MSISIYNSPEHRFARFCDQEKVKGTLSNLPKVHWDAIISCLMQDPEQQGIAALTNKDIAALGCVSYSLRAPIAERVHHSVNTLFKPLFTSLGPVTLPPSARRYILSQLSELGLHESEQLNKHILYAKDSRIIHKLALPPKDTIDLCRQSIIQKLFMIALLDPLGDSIKERDVELFTFLLHHDMLLGNKNEQTRNMNTIAHMPIADQSWAILHAPDSYLKRYANVAAIQGLVDLLKLFLFDKRTTAILKNAVDRSGNNIALIAAYYGHTTTHEWILSKPQLEHLFLAVDTIGNTIAHKAAFGGHTANLEWILSKPKLEHLLFAIDKVGNNIALQTAFFGDITTLEWILSKPQLERLLLDVDKQGDNIAHKAAVSGHTTILEWILSQPKLAHLPFAVNKSGYTCLQRGDKQGNTMAHLAALRGRISIINSMAASPMSIASQILCWVNKEGETVAQIVVIKNHFDIFKVLVADKRLVKSFSIANCYGNNAIHLTAVHDRLDMLKEIAKQEHLAPLLFLKNGAGDTIAEIAKYREYTNLCTWIEEQRCASVDVV